MTPPVTEADLHAYVDRVLDPGRRTEIEAYLARYGDDAQRVRAWRDQNRALRDLYDPVLDESLPIRMRHRVLYRGRPLMRHAALAACFVLGTVAGWYLHSYTTVPPDAMGFARQAAIAHVVYSPEVRHPVEVGADQETHLVSWLSKRLGAKLRVPQLNALGYQLVGGRLLPGNRGPVAQFMFQDASGQRLTLYVRSGSGESRETAFRYTREGGYQRVLLAGWHFWIRPFRGNRQGRAAGCGQSRLPAAQSLKRAGFALNGLQAFCGRASGHKLVASTASAWRIADSSHRADDIARKKVRCVRTALQSIETLHA
jgi:anti-sigma factor RsiW